MKRPALDPSPDQASAGAAPKPAVDPSIEVNVVRGEGGYTAEVQAGGRLRQIADAGPTCAGLAEGLAITLAILLDSDEEPARVASPAPSQPPPPASAPPPVARPAPPPSAPPLDVPAAETELAVHAGVGETVGLIGPLNVAILGEVTLRVLRSITIGAGALGVPTRTIDFPPGSVDVYLAAASLRACVDALSSSESPGSRGGVRASLCALGFGGGLHGDGSAYPINREQLRPWFALGVGGHVEGPIWGRLGFSARMNLLIPLTKESFQVDGYGVAFEPARVGVLAAVGPRLSIW